MGMHLTAVRLKEEHGGKTDETFRMVFVKQDRFLHAGEFLQFPIHAFDRVISLCTADDDLVLRTAFIHFHSYFHDHGSFPHP